MALSSACANELHPPPPPPPPVGTTAGVDTAVTFKFDEDDSPYWSESKSDIVYTPGVLYVCV